MRESEYPGFCDYFIADYSRELADNYKHPIDTAVNIAKNELAEHFPDGVDSGDDQLLCIEAIVDGQSMVVGNLWYSFESRNQSAFILDFYIYEQHRSQGIGKRAIDELEMQLRSSGINRIGLRVAYRNRRALKLYEEVGFVVTGFNMSKTL